MAVALADITVEPPRPSSLDWNDDGVAIVEGLFAESQLLDDYVAAWADAHGYWGKDELGRCVCVARSPNGWGAGTAYMHCGPLRVLCCSSHLATILRGLTGVPMGVHLNLTGWVTSERDWHQDAYLNPPHVRDFYAAVWIALDDIHPDSGPFQYVPGSHRWPQVTRDAMRPYYDLADPDWPKHTEPLLSPLFEAEIIEREAEIVSYLPKRGDVLVWHPRLLHRGSRANVPGMERRALIAHYSGVGYRPDFPVMQRSPGGGYYFPL